MIFIIGIIFFAQQDGVFVDKAAEIVHMPVRIGLGGAKGDRLDRALTSLADLARSVPPPNSPQDTLRIV